MYIKFKGNDIEVLNIIIFTYMLWFKQKKTENIQQNK